MLDTDTLRELIQNLSKVVPSGFAEMKTDLEKNFREVLLGSFAKLDLVTRTEFDVQAKVLARTRKKLEELEAEVKALEKLIVKD